MAVADLDLQIRANPAVVIREVAGEEALRHNEMMARAYGLPPDVNEIFVRLLARPSPIREPAKPHADALMLDISES